MAENDKPTNPPAPPAPKTTSGTPSIQGVTKAGQGEVPETPTNTGVAGQDLGPGNANLAPVSGVASLQPTIPGDATASEGTKTTLTNEDDQQDVRRRTGPGVSTDSPFRRRIRQMESELKGISDQKSRSAAAARATIASQLAELRDLEAKREAGANIRTPRGNLLMAGAVQEQYPDDHLRWVNTAIEGRVDLLTAMGYEPVSDAPTRGSMRLYKIPREQWAKGEIAKSSETERGLRVATGANRDDMLQELQRHFDKEGVKVDVQEVFYGTR